MELLLYGVGFMIIFSFYQAFTRGKVSDEEKRDNPTLLESIASGLGEASEAMRQMRAESEFKNNYCEYFNLADIHIGSAISLAESQFEIDEAMKDDPELAKILNNINKDREFSNTESTEWAISGMPHKPTKLADEEQNSMQERVYNKALNSHTELIESVKEKLTEKPQLIPYFVGFLKSLNLEPLLKDNFTDVIEYHKNLQFIGYFSGAKILSDRDKKAQSIPDTSSYTRESPALKTIAELNLSGEAQRIVKEAQGQIISTLRERRGITDPHSLNSNVGAENGLSEVTTERSEDKACVGEAPKDAHSTAPTEPSDAEAIKHIIENRGIDVLTHFTRVDNLASIDNHGLMSVKDLERLRVRARRNDPHRYDGYLDGISLSVSFPNDQMFYKKRMENPEEAWALLILNPAILYNKNCGFCQFNAADKRVPKRNKYALNGPKSFEAMFDRGIASTERARLRACDPTDPQAEVLVFEIIEPKWITKVIFFDEDTLACYDDVLHHAPKAVEPKWLGKRKKFLDTAQISSTPNLMRRRRNFSDDDIPY